MNRLSFSSSFYPPLACLIFTLMLMLSASTSAEAPRWYEIELALIAYQDNQKIDDENWPEVLINEQASNPLMQSVLVSDQSARDPWSWVEWWNNQKESRHTLYNVKGIKDSNADTIPKLIVPFTDQGVAFENDLDNFDKNQGLKIIWSRKWQQPIPEKEEATQIENVIKVDFKTPLNLHTTANSSAPLLEAEVTGELFLYRSRYLHLVSKLNIQHWQSLDKARPIDQSADILPNHANDRANIIPSNSSTPLTTIDEIPVRAASINQSRRMRSNELHYIDHPMLGVLIRVIPLAE